MIWILEDSSYFYQNINMSFRRIPFQFSSTDPVERQAELEKRFGLPPQNNMYVDVANPLSMGVGKNNGSSSSPRLQHRVPIFMEGYDQPIKSSVDSVGAYPDMQKKPNVRVIPIEIEGDYRPTSRHRTFSGPAGLSKENSLPVRGDSSPLKRSMQDVSQSSKVKMPMGPKVHNIPIKIDQNIPIKIEDQNIPIKNLSNLEKVTKSNSLKNNHSKLNGCAASKQSSKVKTPEEAPEAEQEVNIGILLKKIEDVMEELVSYESDVKAFTGTVKDKQYRYLDEMLTRCMLKLDDVDTMGNDIVRSARKSAVKKVQASIDLLESKMNAENEVKKIEEQAESLSTDFAMKEEESDVPKIDQSMSQNHVPECEMGEDATETASHMEVEICQSCEKGADDMNEVKMVASKSEEQKDVVIVSKEPEVEMADVKDEDSNTESADEIPEVELTEDTAMESKDPVSYELQNETNVSSTCVKIESSTVQDIDMKEVTDTVNRDSVGNKPFEDSDPVVTLDSTKVNDLNIAETDNPSSDSKPIKVTECEQGAVIKGSRDSSEDKITTEL